MNAPRCLKIARRIGTLLEQQIGLGVDTQRMLGDRLYQRDVLLVCDAHRGTELAELASWFRRSAAVERSEYAPSGYGPDSVFPASLFGHCGYDALHGEMDRAVSRAASREVSGAGAAHLRLVTRSA